MSTIHKAAIASAVIVVLTACGTTGKEESAPPATVSEKPAEPVTLFMLQDGATISDEEFEKMVSNPVKAKFPHISVQLVRNSKGDSGLSDLISTGSFPDFTLTTYPRIRVHKNLGVAEDLTSLIAENKVDISKYDQRALETAKAYGDGKLYALPFSLNFVATFYNKDLFDKFGVAYPKEGLLWEETIQLASRFARVVEGVQYKGLLLNGIGDLRTQLSIPYIDAKTNKSLVTSDNMKRVFQLIKSANDIPGNQNVTLNDFIQLQVLALMPHFDARLAALEKLHGTPSDFNWDITQYPSHPDRPNTALISSGHFLTVSALSKHKQESFQVIQFLTSEENQTLITELGRFTALNQQSIKNKYGQNLKSLQGKNIQSVFKSQFASPHVPTIYDSLASPHLNNAVKKVNEGIMDINSALREADDLINKDVANALKQ